MSKITNDCLTQSGTHTHTMLIAVPIWQQWPSTGYIDVTHEFLRLLLLTTLHFVLIVVGLLDTITQAIRLLFVHAAQAVNSH